MQDEPLIGKELHDAVTERLSVGRECASIVKDGGRYWWVYLRLVDMTYGEELLYLAIDKEDAINPMPYVGIGATVKEAIINAKSQIPTSGVW